MADLFAPKLQSEVAYERPVEQPSMLGALAGLGGDFLQSYSASQRRSGGGSGSTKVDPQLGTFAKGLERVEAIRNEKGEQAALIAERQLATNFAMQGIEFDTDYQNVYTKTTGRVWAGYGRDNEDFMREQALQDSQVQASYVASYALLPQDSTDEQRIEYAIGQKATLQASADVIARSKAEQGYQWSVQTEAAYGNAIDTFLNTNLGALVSTQQQGGTVGPQSLANLGASWSQLKVGVSRPSGVSDDQWKSTQAKITSIDNLLTTLTKASSSDVLFEEITTGFASALIAEGGGSTESILAAATAIKDPTSLTNLMGGNVETFIMDVGKSINLDITQPQLFGHIAEQTGLGETVGGNITLDKLPASIASKVEGLSPQQFYDGLKASGQLTKLTDANTLQRPEGRQQFVENSAGIGAVLMGMGNDDFLSASFLKELVGNRQFIQNVKTLDSVDPEGATVARTYVRSGLNTELVRQQRNLAAVEATSTATWNGSNYVIDQDQLRAKTATSRVEGFNRSMQKYYGGDVVAGIRDGFRGVIGDGYTDVVQLAGLYNLEGALDRRDAIGVINDTLKGLAVEEPAGAVTFDVAQLSGQVPVDLINTAESALGLDENKQKDVLATFLSAGGVEIDPSQTAWCAAFVNATLSKTGLDGTGALNARSFLEWGTGVDTPQLGDVVVLSRGADPAKGHVGFFKGFDANGDILILGGNQSDVVSVSSYSKDRLLGYRRPAGITGGGTEAALSQAVYKAATDPTFLPTPTVEVDTAITTSLRPQARPEVAPEEVEVDQTTTEGGSFGGQGLVRVIDSPAYSRELQNLLQALRVDPEQTFGVADLDELEAAQADGRLKAGDKVVVGQGARAFVVELE